MYQSSQISWLSNMVFDFYLYTHTQLIPSQALEVCSEIIAMCGLPKL
jgi:hypothetical protein